MAVGALTVSAALFSAILTHESYTSNAVQPVKGDKWTYGFGSTTKEDGSPVGPADSISPPAAVRLAAKDLKGRETSLKKCFEGSYLSQGEWAAIVDLSYNVGTSAVCRSSLPKKALSQDYEALCKTLLDFKRVQGRDCSLPENKRFCGGVWTRVLWRHRVCLGEQDV